MRSLPLTKLPGTAREQASYCACTQPEWSAPAPVYINTHANNTQGLVLRWQAMNARCRPCASVALSRRELSSEPKCQLR